MMGAQIKEPVIKPTSKNISSDNTIPDLRGCWQDSSCSICISKCALEDIWPCIHKKDS